MFPLLIPELLWLRTAFYKERAPKNARSVQIPA